MLISLLSKVKFKPKDFIDEIRPLLPEINIPQSAQLQEMATKVAT